MSSTTDKITGIANQIAGKGKQVIGDLKNDETLRQEGIIQEKKGVIQKSVGDVKSTVKQMIDES